MADNNQTAPVKSKKSAWQLFNQIFPGISYKVVAALIIIGVIAEIFRWVKWHI